MKIKLFINDDCISCGACQAECPVECIHEGFIYFIDQNKCVGCGFCADICPVEAVIREMPEDFCPHCGSKL